LRQSWIIAGDPKEIDEASLSRRAAHLGQTFSLQKGVNERGLPDVRSPDKGNFRKVTFQKLFWPCTTSDKLCREDSHAEASYLFEHHVSDASTHRLCDTQPLMRKSTAQSRSRRKVLLIIGICLPVGAVLFLWLLVMPDVSALRTTNPKGTALMEARQAQAKAQGRTVERQWVWVPLSRISPHLRQAVVTAEDASFFTHEGFDWEGIKDAALYNLEAGEFKRGGSTITQQLAKNLYLSSERSLLRKARESLIARSLEQHLTKERILELYLNVAEWGQGVYGAEAAARHHFKKPSRALTADEAAWLAAILPSPRRYDPLRKTRFLTRRHERILKQITRGSQQAPQLEPAPKSEPDSEIELEPEPDQPSTEPQGQEQAEGYNESPTSR
jgi:monofunctional biosynthetic peptidoglycan transglycosylase